MGFLDSPGPSFPRRLMVPSSLVIQHFSIFPKQRCSSFPNEALQEAKLAGIQGSQPGGPSKIGCLFS